jgi:hypothetical protein
MSPRSRGKAAAPEGAVAVGGWGVATARDTATQGLAQHKLKMGTRTALTQKHASKQARTHARTHAQALSINMAANNGTNSAARLAEIRDLAAQEVARANPATGSVRRFVLSLRLGLGSEDPDWFGALAEAGVVDALASEGEAVGAQVNVLPDEFPAWSEQRALELDELLMAVSQGAAQTAGDGGSSRVTRSATATADVARAGAAAAVLATAREEAQERHERGAVWLTGSDDPPLSDSERALAADSLVALHYLQALYRGLDAGAAEALVAQGREMAMVLYGVRPSSLAVGGQEVPWAGTADRVAHARLVAMHQEVSCACWLPSWLGWGESSASDMVLCFWRAWACSAASAHC